MGVRPARRPDSLTDVPGVAVGHAEAASGASGVTVVRFARPAPVGLTVLGGASATFDTASLAVDATFGRRWAIFLSGGSVFGLDAARGVREAILRAGGGHRVFQNPNRIAPVSGAALFDLARIRSPPPDYALLGRRAAERATRAPVVAGRFGAGAGARVGKYRGRARSMPGGVGSASVPVPGLGTVGALAVVNAIGAVRDPETGRWVAGARGPTGAIVPPGSTRRPHRRTRGTGTTLVVVATDAPLDRTELARAGSVAATGLARAVVPVATALDGDCLFLVTTGAGPGRPRERYAGAWADGVGAAAADVVARAIVRGVEPLPGPTPAAGRRPARPSGAGA